MMELVVSGTSVLMASPKHRVMDLADDRWFQKFPNAIH